MKVYFVGTRSVEKVFPTDYHKKTRTQALLKETEVEEENSINWKRLRCSDNLWITTWKGWNYSTGKFACLFNLFVPYTSCRRTNPMNLGEKLI